jgi:hypothetical protein
MSGKEPQPPGPSAPDEHETKAEVQFSIAQSNALIPLLVISALTVIVILIVIVRAKPVVGPEGAIANRAFSPEDFPAIFGTDDSLVGLENAPASGKAAEFPVPAPPFTEGIFPCMQCHESMPPNPQRRELTEMHTDIIFTHDAKHRWCLDCHDLQNRDELRLASGTLVPFTESYRLCGQCHGTQYRDWKSGIHGKRTGYWDGPKRYLLCVNCHNPHSPHFAPLKPLPPPVRPQFLRPEEAAAYDAIHRPEGAASQEDQHAAQAD